jgi:L-ascorbate metabolism protein UlaG (beta-lactamase superfamily)
MLKQLNKITYIANAGVMLELGDKKVLIDSFCNSTIPLYKNPSAQTREQMILGISPFDKIDCLLVTHHHPDHFDPESVACFLKYQKNSFVVSTTEVISQISRRLSNVESGRLIKPDTSGGDLESLQIKGIKIQPIFMRHDGEEYRDVPNLAYLIETAGEKVLHVGDAKPIPENYNNLNLAAQNIDLLLAPFPYIGLPKGRQVIEKYIRPRKIAVIHLPIRELDHGGWIDATMKNYLKVKNDFVETVFFEDSGDYTTIS